MTDDDDNNHGAAPAGPRDIGWKQFTIGVFDLVRWPVVAVVTVFVLRLPFERLLDGIAAAFRH